MYVSLFFMILFIIFSIAFVTLYERHLLSLTQNRLGPNKVSLFGVFQPLLDGLKLLGKEQLLPLNSSSFSFMFFPSLLFLILFFDWFCLPFSYFFLNFQFSFLFLLCLVGFSVYSALLSSIMSKSKYSSLGGLRASSQSVSFEIVFSLFFICFLFSLHSFELGSLFNSGFLILFFPFLFVVLAELGRAPFDFSEGESELVSGFNTEFSSVTFILLFLGEYGILLFFSVLGSLLFFGFNSLFALLFFSLFLLIRSSFPRYRYDLLMTLFWKKLLPLSLYFFFFMFFILNNVYFLDFTLFLFLLQFLFFLNVNFLETFSKKFLFSLSLVFSYSFSFVLSSLLSFFCFIFLLFLCFGGYFCYSVVFLGLPEFTFFFSFLCWFSTFLVFISGEKFSVYLSKQGDTYLKSFSMLSIELVSEFSRPVALTVRLTVNILVGHLLSMLLYSALEFYFSKSFLWLFLFAIFLECFVFFIQSYIFARLVFLYMNE